MGRANFKFAGLCALALALAMVVVAWVEDLPVRDPDGVVVPTYVRLPIILLIAWLLDVLPRSVHRSVTAPREARAGWRTPWRDFRTVARERWTRSHVIFSVSGLAAWYVCYAAFRNLKSYVPFVHERIFDTSFHRIDHTLWMGHDPANVLHSWFGTGWAAEFFSAVYVIWIVLIPVSLAIALVWTRHPAAGSWFVTAVALDWLLGVATYYALPTLGPIYSSPGDFADLRHTYATTLEEDLLRDRLNVLSDPHATHAVQTIAAFPSLHVGIMVTVCLFVTLIGLARWIRVTAWSFLVLTVLSTIYLGWHFSLDVLGGAVLGAAAVWLAALGTGNHVGGRPRLVDRGSYDRAQTEEQEPERVSPAPG
ncbi:phosphatase PAP2 family protein [Nocardioides pocheonensis]|nr:phosphatase PAP2 family protein [Nocardioides pocheonensis]